MKRVTLKASRCAEVLLVVGVAFAVLSLAACSSASNTSADSSVDGAMSASDSSSAASQSLSSAGQEGGKAKADEGAVVYKDGSYLWDANGDGNYERLSFDFIDNGDEAPNVISIVLYDSLDGNTADALIDCGYDLETVEGGVDETGPYVVIAYTQGDYYSHDTLARCKMRLIDDELVVEQLD